MNQLKNAAHLLVLGVCHFALANPAMAQIKALPTSEKHRIVLLTDIGGDRDDEQSFTRFMMYADQYDIEGLIATSIRIFPKEKHRPVDGEPQPQHLVKWIQAYSEVRGNLLKHSEGWSESDYLLKLIRKGVKTGGDAPFNIRTGKAGKGSGHYPLDQLIGANKDNGATKLIIEAVDRDDPRPVRVPIWGGRLRKAKDSEKQWIDVPSNILPNRLGHTISRWSPHFQNDDHARMDWCVKEFAEANHPPSPALNGDKSLRAIEVTAKPGEHVKLDATGTTDIDGDSLSYRWQFFPEAGSYKGEIEVENADQATTKLVMPEDAVGKTAHVLLVVSDDGSPALARYRRLVVTCR